METKITSESQSKHLTPQGCSDWSGIAPFLPFGRETWRKLCLAGRAPKPIRLSLRCTVYRNADVLRWLENPADYKDAA